MAKQAIAAHALCNAAYMQYAIGARAAKHGSTPAGAQLMAYCQFQMAYKLGGFPWGI